ncbi:unnamed protein product [Sphacelaria rigidula]
MADGVKEAALYVRGILKFLMPSLGSKSIAVFDDKKGAIDLAEKRLSSSNSIRELVASDDISVKYLQSEEQHAGILTKAID